MFLEQQRRIGAYKLFCARAASSHRRGMLTIGFLRLAFPTQSQHPDTTEPDNLKSLKLAELTHRIEQKKYQNWYASWQYLFEALVADPRSIQFKGACVCSLEACISIGNTQNDRMQSRWRRQLLGSFIV